MSTIDQTTTTRTTILRSSEFTCPSCVRKIEKRLRPMPGVASATVHFSTGRVVVEHDPTAVSVDDLVAAVAEAGYRAAPSSF
ncbi:MAG TPA: heavy metal-associated domain-containing protein [Actinomycetales bacterium]|nr:heavy metal-associated domain-containing protein [Actinomycetales bacterium]